MASVTIRNIDEKLKSKLRVRAAAHGRSMADELRNILTAALAIADPEPENLADAICKRMARFGGVFVEIAPREPIR